MVQEAGILLWIKKLQQSRGGVTLHTTPYLVNLKNKMGRVLCVKRNEMLQWLLLMASNVPPSSFQGLSLCLYLEHGERYLLKSRCKYLTHRIKNW